ncbi:hypothetical protein DWB64_01110 [Fusibacter sp. A1]|nr:hypothetical protein DWB64_01110 [Fusibacter sp. A1]
MKYGYINSIYQCKYNNSKIIEIKIIDSYITHDGIIFLQQAESFSQLIYDIQVTFRSLYRIIKDNQSKISKMDLENLVLKTIQDYSLEWLEVHN